jgi:hypothetical protein
LRALPPFSADPAVARSGGNRHYHGAFPGHGDGVVIAAGQSFA